MPDDNADAADDTRRLRVRFPRWGILFDPLESVWIAVRGKRTLVAASSPEKLTAQVDAAARGEAGPDEGDKTQTWRALRKHDRGLAAPAERALAHHLVTVTRLIAHGIRATQAPAMSSCVPPPVFRGVGTHDHVTSRCAHVI
jgi:hypothetical protein